MPKIQLSFADITILSGNVVHEVDKQFNNAGVPIGNIRFQGKLHTSCIILSKSFSQKKKSHIHFNLLYWAANVPVQLFVQIKNRKCNISSIPPRDTLSIAILLW